jgi:hypothetical protein
MPVPAQHLKTLIDVSAALDQKPNHSVQQLFHAHAYMQPDQRIAGQL